MSGVNVKEGDNPIGRFGTGLKYAVAVILRNGGTIRIHRKGREYEFYVHKTKFRGKEFDLVAIRARGILGSFALYKKLSYTTELGRDWDLWQAYRELESNTRDERGRTEVGDHVEKHVPGHSTITVYCDGFVDQLEDSKVFLDTSGRELIYENDLLKMYEGHSSYIYSQGIRVLEPRFPTMYTYDFKPGKVTLTEDRTAKYEYLLYGQLASMFMNEITDQEILDSILIKNTNNKNFLENYDLIFSDTNDGAMVRRIRSLTNSGVSLGRSANMYVGSYFPREATSLTTTVRLSDSQWKEIVTVLRRIRREDLVTSIIKGGYNEPGIPGRVQDDILF